MQKDAKVVIMKNTFLFLLCAGLALPVLAADEHGTYWIYGVGRQNCSTYLAARKAGGFEEISYKNWIMGYLTAVNRSTPDTYNILGESDMPGALAWLDRHCTKYPDETMYMAMPNMLAVMYPQRRRSKE
ncbi:MAG: hypothetical protein QG652_870 [Pseudomonadota bacterium]|nr:hypothetical protein [Pseudomonadota bacterium]